MNALSWLTQPPPGPEFFPPYLEYLGIAAAGALAALLLGIAGMLAVEGARTLRERRRPGTPPAP